MSIERRRIFCDPNCPKCEGQGMYLHEETGAAVHCDCHDRVRVIEWTQQSNLPRNFMGKTVAGYDPQTDNERYAVSTIIGWLKNYQHDCRGLVLEGSPGNGKTHLLCAIGKGLITTGKAQPLFREITDMFRREQDRMKDDTAPDEFRLMETCKVLLLDDLGSERPTDWNVNWLSSLFNARYSQGRTTVVTTNFTPAQIASTYGERFSERMYDMCQRLVFDGRSRRQGV